MNSNNKVEIEPSRNPHWVSDEPGTRIYGTYKVMERMLNEAVRYMLKAIIDNKQNTARLYAVIAAHWALGLAEWQNRHAKNTIT